MKAEVSVGRVVIDTNVLISAALSRMATPARRAQQTLPDIAAQTDVFLADSRPCCLVHGSCLGGDAMRGAGLDR